MMLISRDFLLRLVGCAMLMVSLAGCGASYNWRVDYDVAEQEARQNNKHMFVFYKWWLDNASNRMLSEEVLSSPEVIKQFQNTVNVLIDKENGPAYVDYMGRYDVHEYPAAVIVAPDGTFHVKRGFVTKDRFLQFINKAMQPTPERPRPAHPKPARAQPRTSKPPAGQPTPSRK